jgi:hypothetical protein
MGTFYVLKRSDGRYWTCSSTRIGWAKSLDSAELCSKDRARRLKGSDDQIVAVIVRRKEVGVK